MPNEKYLDYAGLQYYHEKLNMDLASMLMTDDDLDIVLLDELSIVPPLPETWTESANGTLNLALGNAFSYWPEGAGTKTISITNGTAAGVSHFFLKLTDAGNFFVEWGSNIQWKDGSEPVWQAFNEDIIMFKSNDGGSTWVGQLLQTNEIEKYWKITIKTNNANTEVYLPFAGEFIEYVDWGDGTKLNYNITEYGWITHYYTNSGFYNITMKSSKFNNAYLITRDGDPAQFWSTYFPYLYSINSPLPYISGSYQFNSSYGGIQDYSFYALFAQNTNLTSIPEKLFWNNPNRDIQEGFSECSSLISIPRGLFDKNINTNDFSRMFYMCESLEYIPSNLFLYNTEAQYFYECFYGCSQINNVEIQIGSTKVTSASGFFQKKEGVTRTIKVPSGSTTQTTFNNVASSLGLTIVGV